MNIFDLGIRLTTVALLLFCQNVVFVHGEGDEGSSDGDRLGEYYEACVTYLEEAKESLQSGGLSQLISDGYETYLEYPSGPYVFCFTQKELSVDAVGQSLLVLHPFTENKTLSELLGSNDDEGRRQYLESKANLIRYALSNGTLGVLFNFTEPYSQDKSSTEGGVALDEQDKMLVGFIDTLADGIGLQCGCRYTGVPDGERDNKNAIAMSGGGTEASSTGRGPAFSALFFVVFSLVFMCIVQ